MEQVCQVCRNDDPADMLSTCHWHRIHGECLLGLLEELIRSRYGTDGPRFVCQAKGCSEPLQSEAVWRVARRAQGDLAIQLDNYLSKSKLLNSLTPSQELAFCPTPNCGLVCASEKASPLLVCPKCHHQFCPHCCQPLHLGRPCVSIQDSCIYCKQRQRVKSNCSRVVCYSEFCQGLRAYCAVCRLALTLTQESCPKCHPVNGEPFLPSQSLLRKAVSIPPTPRRKLILREPEERKPRHRRIEIRPAASFPS